MQVKTALAADLGQLNKLLGQLLVFLSDLAVLFFWNRICANVHTVVLLGK